jgi:hypothetical protein
MRGREHGQIATGWQTAEDKFKARQQTIEMMDLGSRLDGGHGQRTAQVRCKLGEVRRSGLSSESANARSARSIGERA